MPKEFDLEQAAAQAAEAVFPESATGTTEVDSQVPNGEQSVEDGQEPASQPQTAEPESAAAATEATETLVDETAPDRPYHKDSRWAEVYDGYKVAKEWQPVIDHLRSQGYNAQQIAEYLRSQATVQTTAQAGATDKPVFDRDTGLWSMPDGSQLDNAEYRAYVAEQKADQALKLLQERDLADKTAKDTAAAEKFESDLNRFVGAEVDKIPGYQGDRVVQRMIRDSFLERIQGQALTAEQINKAFSDSVAEVKGYLAPRKTPAVQADEQKRFNDEAAAAAVPKADGGAALPPGEKVWDSDEALTRFCEAQAPG